MFVQVVAFVYQAFRNRGLEGCPDDRIGKCAGLELHFGRGGFQLQDAQWFDDLRQEM